MSALQSTTIICHVCLMNTDRLQAWQKKNWISISSHFKSHIWHTVVIVLDSRIASCRKHFPSVSQNVLVFFFSAWPCFSTPWYSLFFLLFLCIILGSWIFKCFPFYCSVWPFIVTVFPSWTPFYPESMSHLTSLSTLPLKWMLNHLFFLNLNNW